MKQLILLTALFYFGIISSNAQPGKLDSTFGQNGTVSTAVESSNGQVLLKSDGTIYLISNNNDQTLITHILANGTIDAAYGNNGYSPSIPVYGRGALQSDGKIVVGGGFKLFRFNTDGSLDNTFLVSTGDVGITSVAIQQDAKIVVAGSIGTDFGVARYNTNGTPDLSFSGDGKQSTDFGNSDWAQSVTIQSDGKIVAAGHTRRIGSLADFAIARYNIDGTPDNTFSGDGKQNTAFASGEAFGKAVVIQSDGKIVVAGVVYTDLFFNYKLHFGLARYNPDGSPDAAFSTDGKQVTEFEVIPDDNFIYMDVMIQKDAKLVVAGFYALGRYNTDGSPDVTFSADGKETIDFQISSAAIQSDGKLVVGGSGAAMYLLADVDGTLPTIALVTPANNATYLAHGNVYLTAAASDADGTISKVEFYKGSTLLSTVTSTPYTFKWQNVLTGHYKLIAKATDNDGNVTTSDTVNIAVVPNKAPTVSIINPPDGQTMLSPANIHLETAAQDPDGRITKVEFYNGSTLLTTERQYPYTFDWLKIKTGTYNITAKATDNWGAITTSAVVHISVVPNKAPTVNIINPANGQIFLSPANIHLEAAAQDPDGRITKVEFYNGTTLLTTERKLPYTFDWQNVPAGTYSITAKATDNWGAVTTSNPIKLTVASAGIITMAKRSPNPENSNSDRNSAVSLKLAPNPANNILNIYITGLQKDKYASLSIISASGILLKTKQLKSSDQTMQLNVSSLVSGMYTIKIVSDDKVMYKQFLKN